VSEQRCKYELESSSSCRQEGIINGEGQRKGKETVKFKIEYCKAGFVALI
jgi:hypothetical protein